MTKPKVAGKSWGGPTRSPRGKFPIYSSSLPNTWEPIKRMNGIVAVAAMLRAALGVHEIRARRPLFHLSLSLSPRLILHFLFLYLPLFGLSLLLSALLLALSRSAPPFRLSPNALFTPSLSSPPSPFPVLRESKLLSAGWPAVLPWIYIAALRTPNILRGFDLCETFAKYSSLISAVRNRERARTRARFRVMRGAAVVFPQKHGKHDAR